MRFPYNLDYHPPAPFLMVQWAVPGTNRTTELLSAFVDTGADGTIVPEKYIMPLQLPIDDRKYLRSQWGERRTVDIYRMEVRIGEIRFPFVEIVADEIGDEIVVGRNILNHLILTFNGPNLQLNVRG